MTDFGEMGRFQKLAARASAAEFVDQADLDFIIRTQERADPADGWVNVLYGAMRNRSAPDRMAIATLLLDRGYRVNTAPNGANELLILFETGRLEPAVDASLVARLLDAGCDPNALERRGDRPLTALLRWNIDDTELQPIYDEFLNRDNVDFVRQSSDGNSVIRYLLRGSVRVKRYRFVGQVFDYMERHGQLIPRLGADPRTNFPV